MNSSTIGKATSTVKAAKLEHHQLRRQRPAEVQERRQHRAEEQQDLRVGDLHHEAAPKGRGAGFDPHRAEPAFGRRRREAGLHRFIGQPEQIGGAHQDQRLDRPGKGQGQGAEAEHRGGVPHQGGRVHAHDPDQHGLASPAHAIGDGVQVRGPRRGGQDGHGSHEGQISRGIDRQDHDGEISAAVRQDAPSTVLLGRSRPAVAFGGDAQAQGV